MISISIQWKLCNSNICLSLTKNAGNDIEMCENDIIKIVK